MEPGQLALIPVTFVEDPRRAGARPTAERVEDKTSIDYDVLDVRPGETHFIVGSDGHGDMRSSTTAAPTT
ncbi:MAG: hypothetical protein WAL50_02155 [Kineosporiaceae bacterium]|jgi:hypothetical protein